MREEVLSNASIIVHPLAREDLMRYVREVVGALEGGGVDERRRVIALVALLGVEVENSPLGGKQRCIPARVGDGFALVCTNATSEDVLSGELFSRWYHALLGAERITRPVLRGGKLMFMKMGDIARIRSGFAPRIIVFEYSGGTARAREEQVSGDTLVRAAASCARHAGCGPDEFARLVIDLSSGSSSVEHSDALPHNLDVLERMGYAVRVSSDAFIVVDNNRGYTLERARENYEYYVKVKKRLGKLFEAAGVVDEVLSAGGAQQVDAIVVVAPESGARKHILYNRLAIASENTIIRGAVLAAEHIRVVDTVEAGEPPGGEHARVRNMIVDALRGAGLDADVRIVSWRRATLEAGGVRVDVVPRVVGDTVYGVLAGSIFAPLTSVSYVVSSERVLHVESSGNSYLTVEVGGGEHVTMFDVVRLGTRPRGHSVRTAFKGAFKTIHGYTPFMLDSLPRITDSLIVHVRIEDALEVVKTLEHVSSLAWSNIKIDYY